MELRAFGSTSPLDHDFEASEGQLRAALQSAVEAYHWFDDVAKDLEPDCVVLLSDAPRGTVSELCDRSHALVHQIGDVVGGLFGCVIEYDDGRWYEQCRTSLLHIPYGNSVGFSARHRCSICRTDPGDCPHERGCTYKVVVSRTADGLCTACGSEACKHSPGSVIEVPATSMVDDAILHEVSLTPRPRDPLARITAREIDSADLQQHLGRLPTPQDVIFDHTCMHQCEGIRPVGPPTELALRPSSPQAKVGRRRLWHRTQGRPTVTSAETTETESERGTPSMLDQEQAAGGVVAGKGSGGCEIRTREGLPPTRFQVCRPPSVAVRLALLRLGLPLRHRPTVGGPRRTRRATETVVGLAAHVEHHVSVATDMTSDQHEARDLKLSYALHGLHQAVLRLDEAHWHRQEDAFVAAVEAVSWAVTIDTMLEKAYYGDRDGSVYKRRRGSCDAGKTVIGMRFVRDNGHHGTRMLDWVYAASVIGNSAYGFRVGWCWASLKDVESRLDINFKSGRGLYFLHLESRLVAHTLLDAIEFFASLDPPIAPLPPDPSGIERPDFRLHTRWPPAENDREI